VAGEAKGQIMARITAMRLLCSHPSLLLRSAADFDNDETSTGSAYASELVKAGIIEISAYEVGKSNFVGTSNKAAALFHTLSDVFEEDPSAKVVVFSGFKPMIHLLGQELAAARTGFTSMTGDTPAAERQRRMDRFNNDPRCRVFLSSDAGAYGINLNAGSHLINYDFPWSAGALAQRVARIDRTSSEREQINIVHLYNHGTIEQRQLEMLQQKAEVAGAFVDGKGMDDRGSLPLTLSSLREFLHGPLPLR
jgi:SNF2 family DNA or RNA helicase